MNEDDKRRGDVLLGLMQQAWANFEHRRAYEWKMSLGIWAALGVSISVLLSTERLCFAEKTKVVVFVGALVITALIAVIHFCWLRKVIERNQLDRDIAIHYERPLRSLAACDFTEDIRRKCDEVLKHRGWSFWSEWAITAVLSLALVLTLGVRFWG